MTVQPPAKSVAAPACRVTDKTVAYRENIVLKGVTLEVARGACMAIVGPNGAGKSTLLKAMLGLVPPLTGTAEFFGQSLRVARSRVGYMPQSLSVDWDFPATTLTVVTMGTYGTLGWFRRPGRRERERALAALRQVGLEDLSTRHINELSGGQRPRVFLARALVQEPDLLILDEAFQGVDARSERAIFDVLADFRSKGRTVVLVHHNLATVREFCSDVAILNTELIASGPVERTLTDVAIRRAYDLDGCFSRALVSREEGHS